MAGWWDIEDAALQTQLATFGEPVLVFFAGAPPEGFATRGVFVAPFATSDLNLTRELSNQAPWLGVRVFELPNQALPRQGDTLAVRGLQWEVTDIVPDESGHAKLRLFQLGPWQPTPLPPLAAAPAP